MDGWASLPERRRTFPATQLLHERVGAAAETPGARTRLGFGGFTDEDGVVVLRGLPPGQSLQVFAKKEGRVTHRSEDTLAGTGVEPPELVIELAQTK